MLTYTAFILVSGIVASLAADIEPQFIDCPGGRSLTMTCCKDRMLPKNCECYDISSNGAYSNSMSIKPECPWDLILFFFHSRHSEDSMGDFLLPSFNFKYGAFNKKTVIIAYGFREEIEVPWYIEMKDAILKKEDINVIIVDWDRRDGPFGRPTEYNQATANARVFGSMVARLILNINKDAGTSLENFHLIGHGLGAHIMGMAGKEVFRLTRIHVGHITGLDPIGPNFEFKSYYVRIELTDAMFVDVIHTNAELLKKGGFGMRGNYADVDFYPNGGVHQPQCPEITKGFLLINNTQELDSKTNKNALCSHRRAVEYYINSISKCNYVPADGNKACTMGYYVSRSCNGVVNITTTNKAPWC